MASESETDGEDFIEFDPSAMGFHDAAWSVQALCPHCDREEEFGDEFTARAWITGHIQEQHSDELPNF